MGIYRTSYLIKETIPIIIGKTKEDIKQSFTGGSTDMFIPYLPKDKKLYAYDVNSLYPFVMMKIEYPIGDPIYFIGELTNLNIDISDKLGFYHCKIKAPIDIKHPILQIHHKTTDGIRTISPVGNFEGWFFS